MRADPKVGKKLMNLWTREKRDISRGLSQMDILIRNMAVDDRVNFLSNNPGMIREFRSKGMLSNEVINALRIKGVM
jgi:hypothetical protein